MINILKKFKYQLFLLIVVAFIGLVNYRFGTYLTGWDNLQTELAPALAVKRAFFAVWQEYQSFGLVGGMAHASDLLRASIVWLMSFVLPQSLVRYVFHVSMWYIGGLGTYTLLQFARWRDGGQSQRLEPNAIASSRWDKERQNLANWSIFAGALFYMLNFATIQLFFLPFEPFSIFFASLPWLVWAFLSYLQNKSSHSQVTLPALFAINVLATPSFYVQTIFVVYLLVLGIISLWHLVSSIKDNTHTLFSRAILSIVPLTLAFSMIMLTNLFWILPQGYFLMSGGSQTVANAKINQLSTEDVYYQNRARGNIASFATFKGFYTDIEGRNNSLIMEPWNKHFSTLKVEISAIVIFAIILLGFTRKSTYRTPFFGIWALCAFALLSDTPVISSIHDLIRHNNLIAQIFRAPFTKFAVPFALSSSFFFTQGLTQLATLLSKMAKRVGGSNGGGPVSELPGAMKQTDGTRSRQNLPVFSAIIGFLLILVVSFPVFTGHLFSDLVRVSIPQSYFQTIDYYKTINKEQRIALLPQDSFWGWYNYSWGYTGSGFLWYGIEQPMVSPTFDVWSSKSEGYLWEMKAALASQQAPRVHDVLTKYNIHYLIVDDSLLPVSSHQSGFSASRIKELLAKDEKITLEKQFGTVSIYHITSSAPFVTQTNTLPSIGPVVDKTDVDSAYATLGDYQSGSDYYFPFLNLFSQTRQLDRQTNLPSWYLEENLTNFAVKTQLPINSRNYSLQSTAPVLPHSMAASIQGNMFALTVNKDLIEHVNITSVTPTQCDTLTICLAYTLPNLAQEKGYLIKIKSENTSGQRFFFYVQNNSTGEGVIEDRLTKDTEYYFIPPGSHFGRGYTIGFQNDSYKGILSENSLLDIEVYEIPYNQLKSLYFQRNPTSPMATQKHDNSTVIFHQAFDQGWKAYSNGKELKNHVVINGWANGWTIQGTPGVRKHITFFFFPQILEYIGLGLVGLIGLICLIRLIIKRI